jgi:hypothetical protein
MKFRILLLSCLLGLFVNVEQTLALSVVEPLVSENVMFSKGQDPDTKLKKEKKSSKKIKKEKGDKTFPLFATLATVYGVLGLGFLALGIYLTFPAIIALFSGLFAVSALVLGVLGLKKGESKTFCYVGIMLGVVGILGTLFYLISVLS